MIIELQWYSQRRDFDYDWLIDFSSMSAYLLVILCLEVKELC